MTDNRFRCEVRHVLSLAAKSKQESYLLRVSEKRGKQDAEKLRMAAREQWQRGNRGAWGEWFD